MKILAIAAVAALLASGAQAHEAPEDRGLRNWRLIQACADDPLVCIGGFVRRDTGQLEKISEVEPRSEFRLVGTTTVFDLLYSSPNELLTMDVIVPGQEAWFTASEEWRSRNPSE